MAFIEHTGITFTCDAYNDVNSARIAALTQ